MTDFAEKLLSWYDLYTRELPWRVGPARRRRGETPDPYRVWLSEIMLQQTTVATVTPRFELFLQRWPTVEALADAPEDDVLGAWAGLGYYARARNLHRCAQVVASEFAGQFPSTEDALLALPGVGPYTAAAVAAIAFDAPAVVIDGNIERVGARLWAIESPIKKAKPHLTKNLASIWPADRSGDFAQALMDLGSGVCTPRSPACPECPVRTDCMAAKKGDPARFPIKPPKKARPKRRGVVYLLSNSRGEILLEKRPPKGLLGGMYVLPGSPWMALKGDDSGPDIAAVAPDAEAGAPAAADWSRLEDVRHVFTHFELTLAVFAADAPKGYRRNVHQKWVLPKKAETPTVIRKAIDLFATHTERVG